MKRLAHEEELAVYLVRYLGGRVDQLDVPFPCVLHESCEVSLTRGGNGEILYHDPSLARRKRLFQTVPELAAARLIGKPKRLRGLQLALWSLRLLHSAGLIDLQPVVVPPVDPRSHDSTRRARDGLELLLRCRWFLDPGEPVAYTRSFVEGWCGIPKPETRRAIWALIEQRVMVKVAEAVNGREHPTSLYRPGTVMPT